MRHLNVQARTGRAQRGLTLKSRAQRGLTLIELMVGLAIGALLMLSAAPYLGDYISNSRLRENGNLLLSEALLAQSEAVKRNGNVALVTDGTTVTVQDVRTSPAVVLRTRSFSGGVLAPTATITFTGDGRLSTWPDTSRVNLSASGVTCSDETRCPALVVEAGGAIRLCGNRLSCS